MGRTCWRGGEVRRRAEGLGGRSVVERQGLVSCESGQPVGLESALRTAEAVGLLTARTLARFSLDAVSKTTLTIHSSHTDTPLASSAPRCRLWSLRSHLRLAQPCSPDTNTRLPLSPTSLEHPKARSK